jgi:hypothetical protein
MKKIAVGFAANARRWLPSGFSTSIASRGYSLVRVFGTMTRCVVIAASGWKSFGPMVQLAWLWLRH